MKLLPTLQGMRNRCRVMERTWISCIARTTVKKRVFRMENNPADDPSWMAGSNTVFDFKPIYKLFQIVWIPLLVIFRV